MIMIGTAIIMIRTHLGHVGVQEQFEIIMDNTFADRVNVGESITRSFEREESNQIDNLNTSEVSHDIYKIKLYVRLLLDCKL